MRFTIPAVTPTNNRLKRMHWAKFRRLNQAWAQLVWLEVAGRKRGGWPDPPPVFVHVTVERVGRQLLDYDNLVGGCKPLIDALKANRLIQDDSPYAISQTYSQRIGDPHMTVTLEATDEHRDPGTTHHDRDRHAGQRQHKRRAR